MVYLISTDPSPTAVLKHRATNRLKLALADSTSRSYDSKFRIFLSFCSFATIDIKHISPLQILTFLEFLTFNKVSFSGLANHLSAVKTSLSLHGLDVSSFLDPRIKLYNKAIMRHRPLNPSIKPIIDIDILQAIALQCDRMHMGHICKAAILLAFFSFLRISNLVPHSIVAYDHLKHLSRADLIFAAPGMHIIVKWSKTLQNRDKVKIIKVPSLGKSPLCPVSAVKKLLSSSPGSNNSPLFQVKCYHKWVPLTDTRLRKFLAKVLKALHLTHHGFTFHSLRRSGATLAFNLNVPMQDIQSHGTWTSEAVWAYITQDHNAADTVAHSFRSLLKT